MKSKFFTILIAILLVVMIPAGALALTPSSDLYVTDEVGLLTSTDKAYILDKAATLDGLTGAQICIVTVDFYEGNDIEDYCYKIFNEWGIGDAQKDNGVLILIAYGNGEYYGMVGTGLSKVIDAGTMKKYFNNYMLDDFNNGNYSQGLVKIFDAIADDLASYYNVSLNGSTNPVTPGTPDPEPTKSYNLASILAAILLIILVIIILTVILRSTRRRPLRRTTYVPTPRRRSTPTYNPYNRNRYTDDRHDNGPGPSGYYSRPSSGGSYHSSGGSGSSSGGSHYSSGGSHSSSGSSHSSGSFGGGSTRGGGSGGSWNKH